VSLAESQRERFSRVDVVDVAFITLVDVDVDAAAGWSNCGGCGGCCVRGGVLVVSLLLAVIAAIAVMITSIQLGLIGAEGRDSRGYRTVPLSAPAIEGLLVFLTHKIAMVTGVTKNHMRAAMIAIGRILVLFPLDDVEVDEGVHGCSGGGQTTSCASDTTKHATVFDFG